MLDGFSGYNQVLVAEEDKHNPMTFMTPWGTSAYKKIPFGLNNSSSTLQRAMDNAFGDMIGKTMIDY